MKHIKKIDWENLTHEYGLDGQRLLPWINDEFHFPFGGAYCVVKGHTSSTPHINEPRDEEELFISIAGKALVHMDESVEEIEKGDVVAIPAGCNHYIENPNNEEFHFYTLWWNKETIADYQKLK